MGGRQHGGKPCFAARTSVEVVAGLADGRSHHVCRTQIYHASDSEMEEHALKALKALLETLYPDGAEEAVSNDASKSVARRLSDACLLELKDSNKSNAKPASRILARAISASGASKLGQRGRRWTG